MQDFVHQPLLPSCEQTQKESSGFLRSLARQASMPFYLTAGRPNRGGALPDFGVLLQRIQVCKIELRPLISERIAG